MRVWVRLKEWEMRWEMGGVEIGVEGGVGRGEILVEVGRVFRIV